MSTNKTQSYFEPLVKTLDKFYPNICYYVLDLEYKYLYFNDVHAQIMQNVLGVTVKLNESALLDFKDNKLRKNIQKKYDDVIAGNDIDDVTTSATSEDKNGAKLFTYYRPLCHEPGEVQGIIVIANNRSPQDQSSLEKELIRSESLMRETNALAKIGGWELDLKTNKSFFTSGTFDIYDIDNQEVPAVNEGIEFYTPEAQQVLLKALDDVMKDHGSYDLELDFISKKGVHKKVRTQGNLSLEDGKPTRLYGAIQDVTEYHKVKATLKKNRERFVAIYEGAPLPITMLSLDGNMLGVNSSFKKIIGYDLKEIPNLETWYSLVYDDIQSVDAYRAEWKEILDEAENGNSIFTPFMRKVRCKDGALRKMEFHLSRLDDFFIIIFIDVTEKIKAENALKVGEQLYRNLYNQSPVMIDSLDSESTILRVNDFWLNQLGYSREDVLGKKIYDFIHPDDVEYAKLSFNRFLITHVIQDIKFRFIKANSDSMNVMVNTIA
jgi:PAS domain S-box-containing protein